MKISQKAIVQFLLERYPDLIAIYLFGSYAEETQTIESDIDLAILPVKPLNPGEQWRLSQQLACILNCNVDLIDLKRTSTVMQMQTISRGKNLYESNRFKRESFEDYVFSSYARLNEERKGIIKDIIRRGTVYG